MNHLIKSYINFLFNSKNEHGVHSPFVFDLVTKCFYKKDNYNVDIALPTDNRLILKTINYLKLSNCANFTIPFNASTEIDCIIVSSKNFSVFSLDTIFPYCKNNTCIFIEDIHRTENFYAFWKTLCLNENFSVSIETFNLGLLFFRKEQKKEHFIINPNKTISSHLFERIRF